MTANIRFIASEPRFYERGFRQYDAPEATGVALDDLDRAATEMVEYFHDDAADLRIIVTDDGQEVSLFSTREIDHMRDVKTLIRAVYRLNEISLAYILSYIAAVYLWSRERSLRWLAREAILGVAVGVAMLIAVGGFAVTGFDAAWTKFHEIAFTNDLWQLDPSRDHLIQMFPEPFWQEATYLVGIVTAVEAMLVIAVAASYLVFTRGAARAPALPR